MFNELIKYCTDNGVSLVVVTKTRTEAAIMNYYNLGHRAFGENRVQELTEKYVSLPQDIKWHMIGHLQSNKVKYIAPFVSMIHSGSNFSLLKEINKKAKSNDRIIDVLLQIKIGQEDTKSGWGKDELLALLAKDEIQSFEYIRFRGVMGMATFTEDKNVIRSEFSELKSIYELLRKDYFSETSTFDIISMGMSGDYEIAIEEGSTMVRIGSLLF